MSEKYAPQPGMIICSDPKYWLGTYIFRLLEPQGGGIWTATVLYAAQSVSSEFTSVGNTVEVNCRHCEPEDFDRWVTRVRAGLGEL